jgi:hypothetical protein
MILCMCVYFYFIRVVDYNQTLFVLSKLHSYKCAINQYITRTPGSYTFVHTSKKQL